MAWAERYVSPSGAGSHDGTVGNAWTIDEALTAIGTAGAPTRVNMIAGTYSYSGPLNFNTVGSGANPIWWRGYQSTIGDQDANNAAVAGTHVPLLSFSGATSQLTLSGACQRFSNICISGACTSANGQCVISATSVWLYRVRITNTAANANARAVTIGSGGSSLMMAFCEFSTTITADCVISNAAIECSFFACRFPSGKLAITAGGGRTRVTYCLFNGMTTDALLGGHLDVVGCSFYNISGNGVNISAAANGVRIANCYFEEIRQSGKYPINISAGASCTNAIIGNAYYLCNGLNFVIEDFAIYDNASLSASAFTNAASGDFSLSTYGKAIGQPGLFENTSAYRGYMDVGAVQRQEPAGGGGINSLVGGGLVT